MMIVDRITPCRPLVQNTENAPALASGLRNNQIFYANLFLHQKLQQNNNAVNDYSIF